MRKRIFGEEAAQERPTLRKRVQGSALPLRSNAWNARVMIECQTRMQMCVVTASRQNAFFKRVSGIAAFLTTKASMEQLQC